MTHTTAFAVLAAATRDAARVAGALCTLATIANLTGQYWQRDANVEAAADLLQQSAHYAQGLRPGVTIARLSS